MTSKRRILTEVLRPSRFVPVRPLARTRSAGICSTHDHFPLPLSNSADTAKTVTPKSGGQQSNSRSRMCRTGDMSGTFSLPHLRVAPELPTYSSLQKGGDPAAGSPTATLLRLRPSHCARLRRLGPLRVPAPTSGAHSFHGVTGGVYKARERIHRGVADPRLLAIPASCRRVADDNPN